MGDLAAESFLFFFIVLFRQEATDVEKRKIRIKRKEKELK